MPAEHQKAFPLYPVPESHSGLDVRLNMNEVAILTGRDLVPAVQSKNHEVVRLAVCITRKPPAGSLSGKRLFFMSPRGYGASALCLRDTVQGFSFLSSPIRKGCRNDSLPFHMLVKFLFPFTID